MANPIGTHIIGDLRGCDPDYLFNLDMEEIKKKVSEIIRKNNLTELGSYYYRFDNNSFTGIVALSESHVSMHTWPEIGVVNMDVYTCNYQNDNTELTRKMFKEIVTLFGASDVRRKEIQR
ncbi:MAG: adenosylmethionine decarboxylase [Candidatus Moranbacteria bacterium]|nr:adenosylmethionine decarboxylase [Candidatus Moranbacteria bacterium]